MGVTSVVQQAGILWYASERGVEGIDVENKRVLAATAMEAHCFLADLRTGLLFCGTGNGIFGYQGNRWQPIKMDGTDPKSAVRALAVDAQNAMWCASNLGLGKIVGSFLTGFTWQTTYDIADGLPSQRVDCLCVDNQSVLWCGTPLGLARYQPTTETFTADPAIEAGVIALTADRQGQLFVATEEGLNKWDGKRWSGLSGWRQHFADSAVPQCLLVDDSGSLWCGTSAGLVVRNEGIWQGIDLGGAISVQGLAVDHQGGLWCGTDAGLIKVENARGISLQAFLEKSVPALPQQNSGERPTTVAIPLSPTLSDPGSALLPTVINLTELLDVDPTSQPTLPPTPVPYMPPVETTVPPNRFIRLSASPTKSTIPIGGKEIFQIQVERQNTDASISFAGLSGSQGITATVIQKDANADLATLLVSATQEAVPGNYTLRVEAEAPGIVIYSCSLEITVVSEVQGLKVKNPDESAPTLVIPTQPQAKSNLMPLAAVLLLFLGGGGLLWLLGRSAGNSTPTTPISERPAPTPPQLDPKVTPTDPQATLPNTQTETTPQPQPQPEKSNDFGEAEATRLINNWQKIKQEIYADPQNTDGDSKLRSVLTGVMLGGSSGNGGRLHSWQQLRSEKQFWRFTQGSIALVPGTFQRVDDHTAFAVIAMTESGEKFDSAGNLLKDVGSPYYDSTYQVKYRFAYDDQTEGWRLAECWGTTKTLRSCELDRDS